MAHDVQESGGVRVVSTAITIQRPQREVYAQWRNLSGLPRFLQYVRSVSEAGERSHWVIDAPGGTLEWEAEITADVPGQVIRWKSVGDAEVVQRGEIRFTPARQGRGTEVYVTVGYRPPGGRLSIGVAKVMGKGPGIQIDTDLHRFKQFMETGTIATTHGQSRGAAQQAEWHEEQAETDSSDAESRAGGVSA
jgi:uncharacterized membrane protein